MPIPISAYYIIGTSFPPSPTQAILFPVILRIFFATIAFYVGLHLQTQTDFAPDAASKNL